MRRAISYLLPTAVLLLCTVSSAAEEDAGAHDKAAEQTASADDAVVAKEADEEAHLAAQAEQIRALMAGTLDPSVDVGALFVIDLGQNTASPTFDIEALVKRIDILKEEAKHRRRSRKAVPLSDTDKTPDAAGELMEARAEFFALPDDERARRIEAHEARRRAMAATAAEAEATRRRLDEMQLTATRLRAFMDHTLDTAVDPHPLLRLNLADLNELVMNPERRHAFLTAVAPADTDAAEPWVGAEAPPIPQSSAGNDIGLRLAEAGKALDAVRRQFIALTADQRASLFQIHAQRQKEAAAEAAAKTQDEQVQTAAEAEATQVSAEREAALAASRRAHTEAVRMLEEERARLLGVKAAQARYEATLDKARRQIGAYKEQALSWHRRVQALEARSLLDGDKQADADRLYTQLVENLTAVRNQLGASLSTAASAVPSPAKNQESTLPTQVDDRSLQTLRQELEVNETRLRNQERELRWDKTSVHRDVMVTMNQERLRLFAMLSIPKRSALTGFGPDGVRQALREVDQIVLDTRFLLSALPQYLTGQIDDLKTSPVPLVWLLLKLSALLLLFRWWRRRADRLLTGILEAAFFQNADSFFSRRVESAVWYLKEVRRPLEWLLFFAVLTKAIGMSTGRFVEIQHLWIILWEVLLWTLLGSFFIRLLNAISQRQGNNTKASSDLRFSSLRLVGISVVVVGLFLSVAEIVVGQGALYGWVISTCWFLAIPILIILIAWWKRTIFVRAEARIGGGALLGWVKSHSSGAVSFPAAFLGGGYLLGAGLSSFFLKQASHLAVTRRVLAYLFRREVEKQASKSADDDRYAPIDKARYDSLSPVLDHRYLVSDYMLSEVETLRQLVRSDNHLVIAVLGERGLGKSTFMKRVMEGVGTAEVFQVSCEPGGFDVLLRGIAAILHLDKEAGEDRIVDHLKQQKPQAIFVDNAQRLIRPLIGGLKDIDQLIQFARRVGPGTSWLIGIETPAWQYLSRARGDRAAFDEHVVLRPWTEDEIGELVSLRSDAAGLAPDFSKLAVPRQAEAMALNGEERTRHDFYRFLWDYADGNPQVALHFWRESLSRRLDDNQIYVRLFKAPSPDMLLDLPSTLYFVLRAIVQMELALETDIVQCTDLRTAEVADALRSAKSKGYVEHLGNHVRIALPWYRAVTDVLRRRHLLIL